MSLASRNLLQDKLRSTLRIAGVGLAIMLILILNGFLIGMEPKEREMIEPNENARTSNTVDACTLRSDSGHL